jgi:hypothetical protein
MKFKPVKRLKRYDGKETAFFQNNSESAFSESA